MRFSKFYVPTLKEAPSDAEIISHKLLLRAGLIRKLTAGIYSWLPLGLKALNNVANIVREEMNAAGAQEILMPTVQPGDLWEESGRWDFYGKELLRFKDRHDRAYCLGPTHEEVVTDLVRGEVRSYRQLPLNLYQIQTKFRDEIRPRFGLMRGREFVMKDAYSFDRDDAGADLSYQAMFQAYKQIFTRLGLKFRAVEADSGAIGGSFSHEFMVLAETGEDLIAYCDHCDWSANVERAATVPPQAVAVCAEAYVEVSTPKQHTIAEVAAFLNVPATKLIKSLVYLVDAKPVLVLVRGDREVNEIKLKNFLKAQEVVLADAGQVMLATKAPVGFAGPVGYSGLIVADHELRGGTDWIVGANKADAHFLHADLGRDSSVSFTDLRSIVLGDVCPHCQGSGKHGDHSGQTDGGQGKVSLAKGIEVGHVFKLGTKYSESMRAIYLDEQGKEQTMIMGCYGIGVSRVVAAAIEQNNDADGIIFPPAVAPFQVMLLNLDVKNAETTAKAEEIYTWLQQNKIAVLLDDREERPGIKFKDADLLGFPVQITVGAKALARGVLEVKNRKTQEKQEMPVQGFTESFTAYYQTVLSLWK